MLEIILNSFNEEVKKKFAELEQTLYETLDFSIIEQELAEILNMFSALILQAMLNQLLSEPVFLAALKQMGGRMGMKYKEHRTITVRLHNGQTIEVKTPYFIKAEPNTEEKEEEKEEQTSPFGISGAWFHRSWQRLVCQ